MGRYEGTELFLGRGAVAHHTAEDLWRQSLNTCLVQTLVALSRKLSSTQASYSLGSGFGWIHGFHKGEVFLLTTGGLIRVDQRPDS